MFSFPLRLFVPMILAVVFPQEVCTPALPKTLVHFSALRCFWWSAMLMFSFSFFSFYIYTATFLFIFIVCLSIDSFELQMFVCSVSHWVGGLSILFYLCGWLPGGHRVHFPPCGVGSGSWCFVTTLLSSLTLLSLYAVVVTLLICVFWKLHYTFFSIQWAQQRTLAWLSKVIMNPFTHWLFVVCSLVTWKGSTAPFQ